MVSFFKLKEISAYGNKNVLLSFEGLGGPAKLLYAA